MYKKPKTNGNFRPEGRPPSILGTGLAECADPAEALELASSIDSFERAFRRAMFLCLWVCGCVGLWDCGVAG